MRKAAILASCLGLLLSFGLAACELDPDFQLYTPCFDRDSGTYVPCCGPTGSEYRYPPDAGDDAPDGGEEDVDAGEDDGGPEAGAWSGCPANA